MKKLPGLNLLAVFATALLVASCGSQCGSSGGAQLPAQGERLVIIGNGLAHRMLYFPHFEALLQSRYPGREIVVRNLGRPGDTPALRPHPARNTPWAFEGAEAFYPGFVHKGKGHYPYPDEWLSTLQADTVLAMFGYNESFAGEAGLEAFRAELAAFVKHSKAQAYNGKDGPRIVLASPIAFEDLSDVMDLPDGEAENRNLATYAAIIKQVAGAEGVDFIDLYGPTAAIYEAEDEFQTINGFSLTDDGYKALAPVIADGLYGTSAVGEADNTLYEAVKDKNWFWLNDYWMLNGVHVYGRRFEPFGNVNYPEEIEKIRQMTELRDARIHGIAIGDIDAGPVDDSATRALTPIETNYKREIEFLNVDKAVERFKMPYGFKIDLFASESEFPELRNPVQMSFDTRGRMWVAVAPSYPHYKPGDTRPNDKLIILEDTDGDGRADTSKVFADGLHLPFGFELAAEGVYLAQLPNLVRLVDTDGDDRADRTDLLLHGFDPHDSHHGISAFTADASGGILMTEGVFLHSQVETPYGVERAVDAGVWRFDPKTWRVERFMQSSFANPWGIAVDEWGQSFLADASPGDNWWALPLSAKAPHGVMIGKVGQFTTHRVRPTSGVEFVSSRHFPDEMQGDYLINNTIGFLGTKQHTMEEDGAGYTGKLRQDLVFSDDPNFRPVELEFGPDGALYVVDWHNPLIGHMQHSARDPNRDSDHGRIYRVTHTGKPLVEPATIAGAPIGTLLENLTLPEYRTRYRTRRELRGRDQTELLPVIEKWAASLDPAAPDHDRTLLEILWVIGTGNDVGADLLDQVLASDDHRARAGAIRTLRYNWRKTDGYADILMKAVGDPHPRVRLEAAVVASWIDGADGARIALEGLRHPVTRWMGQTYDVILQTLEVDIRALHAAGGLDMDNNPLAEKFLAGDLKLGSDEKVNRGVLDNVRADDLAILERGRELYMEDGSCATCHGADGKGAVADYYPPLNSNRWVNGDPERFAKLVLKGLYGPIEVKGKTYGNDESVPPMPGFGGMLDDEEIAAIMSWVRVRLGSMGSSSGKSVAGMISPEVVAAARKAAASQDEAYLAASLLEEHPHEE